MSFGIKRMAVALQFLKHIILDHYSSPNVQIDPSFFNFRTPVPIWNVCCSMSSSNCCFFTCIQVSQETGKMVWYSHLCKNSPHFVVIHTVKGVHVANEAEVNVFLKLPCFLYDPMDVGNLISDSSALSKSRISGSSQFTNCQSLAWGILSITLLACEMSATVL